MVKEVIITVKKRPSLYPKKGKSDPRAGLSLAKLLTLGREYRSDSKRPASTPG